MKGIGVRETCLYQPRAEALMPSESSTLSKPLVGMSEIWLGRSLFDLEERLEAEEALKDGAPYPKGTIRLERLALF